MGVASGNACTQLCNVETHETTYIDQNQVRRQVHRHYVPCLTCTCTIIYSCIHYPQLLIGKQLQVGQILESSTIHSVCHHALTVYVESICMQVRAGVNVKCTIQSPKKKKKKKILLSKGTWCAMNAHQYIVLPPQISVAR